MNRRKILFYLGYAVALLSLLSLLLLSQATQGSQKFENYYQPLLITIAVGILCLLSIVIIYFYDIFSNYRRKLPGASLSLTILWRTLLLAAVPFFFIAYFAFKFLNYEFQSSFDEGINDALNSALVLSQKALDVRAVQALEDSHEVAKEITFYNFKELQTQLNKVRRRIGAHELTVFDEKGFIQAFAGSDLSVVLPLIPDHSAFSRVESEGGIFTLEKHNANFSIRTLIDVDKYGSSNYYLQAVFQIPDTVSNLTEQVNRTINERDRFNYLMPRVSRSFVFVLILVVLLASLLLILSSIGFAGDMAKPIRDLVRGTKRVSKGDFEQQLIIKRNDDFGTLMQSFNGMTQSLKHATEEIEHNRDRIESERAYLATVINHMTAGVVTLDYQYRLQTYNERAKELLACDLSQAIYCDRAILGASLAAYKNLVNQVLQHYENGKQYEIEIEISTTEENKTLITNLTPLPSTDALHGGYVMIFEVLSDYLQKQKQAAWEEVARRLAHEIKNPLTPIQLAAERLNYKLSGQLDDKQQKMLSRSVDVITKQVTSLKDMVNDFSDFAKPLVTQKKPLKFSPLLNDVFDLYRGHYANVDFHLNIATAQDRILGNAQVLRQVLHNLLKNAIEACEMRGEKATNGYRGDITIALENSPSYLQSQEPRLILTITDNGIGLTESESQVFEPYVTTKEKGTGLGLAIVKKIIQEHQGAIKLKNRTDEQGTVVEITLSLLIENITNESNPVTTL